MRKAPLFATAVALVLLAGLGYSIAMRRAGIDHDTPLRRAVATLLGRPATDGSNADLAARRAASAPNAAATQANAAASSNAAGALPFSPQRPAPPLPLSGSWTAPPPATSPPGASPSAGASSTQPAPQAASLPPFGTPPRGADASSGLAVMSATTRGPQAQPLASP